VRDVAPDHLRMIRMVFARLGVETLIEGHGLRVPRRAEAGHRGRRHGAIPKVDDAPWPGLPADLNPLPSASPPNANGTCAGSREALRRAALFLRRHSLNQMGARIRLLRSSPGVW